MAPFALPDAALLAQCRVETFRSGGPGGQHANRTESAVRLTHLDSGISAICQDHRERGRNQHDALMNLRIALALALRGRSEVAWVAAWRRGARVVIGANHADYPQLVAVCLDALDRAGGRLAEAAASVSLSTSQLVKLLTADGRVHQAANALRQRHGQGAIHGR